MPVIDGSQDFLENRIFDYSLNQRKMLFLTDNKIVLFNIKSNNLFEREMNEDFFKIGFVLVSHNVF